MKKTILIFYLILIPLAGFCPAKVYNPNDPIFFEIKKRIFINAIYTKEFSPELLKEGLLYAEIDNPGIVYRQALLETGNFSSELFREGNNLFGMRLARVRPTCATCIEYNYHATYAHWWDSVIDYKLLQDWYSARGYDLTDYYDFLTGMRYATDQNYIDKLKSISDIS